MNHPTVSIREGDARRMTEVPDDAANLVLTSPPYNLGVQYDEHDDQVDLSGIAWAIVGGESGPGYRDMENEWAVEILEQCREQGTRFFFKQSSGLRPGQNPYLTIESADSGLMVQREIREVPEPHPAARRAREARS